MDWRISSLFFTLISVHCIRGYSFFFTFWGGLEELDYTFVTDSMKTHTDENSIILWRDRQDQMIPLHITII